MPSVQTMPTMPPPAPAEVDPAVVQAGDEMKRKARGAAGYSSTITNSGGGSGIVTPAFTSGSAGFKALTGL